MGTASQQSSTNITIIENIHGHTFYEGEVRTFSSIAFRDGKVFEVAVDGHLEIDREHARIIDGDGRTMLPGLIDAHGHVMGLGYNEIDIDLAGIESLDKTFKKVSSYAGEHLKRSWIRGRGWNNTRWPHNRFRTVDDLGQVVSNRPVWLERVDGHAGWANSKAMELAGITTDTESPEDGQIIR